MTAVLTDDEFTVLLIAAEGESLMPIGRWEKPIETLVQRGLLNRYGQFNNVINAAGRKALAERDAEADTALKQVFSRSQAVAVGLEQIRAMAEAAAQQLAAIAKASKMVTGDSIDFAAKRWSETILRRALEIIDAG